MFRCILIVLLGLGAACTSRLETGYEPRKLSSTEAERRAYYADPFSPEARAAEGRPGSRGR